VKGKVVLRYYVSVALLLSIASFSTGCKRQLEPEGYRVVAYDGHTYQWTIIRTGTFDGQYLKKRLVVVCSSYKWGNHESVNGPEACHLQVGRMIVPIRFLVKLIGINSSTCSKCLINHYR